MKKTLPTVYILIAAVLWGCIGLFYKQLAAIGFSQLQVVFLRVVTAAIGMGIYILLRDPSLFHICLKDIWMFVGTGVISLACFNFCYFTAMDQLSVSVAATLLYTAPIFVMLLSTVLFRESLTLRKVIAVIATFLGCMLVTGVVHDRENIAPVGLLFGLGSGIGYALYSIFGVFALRRYRTQTVTFYTFLFASLSVLPICDPRDLILIARTNMTSSILYTLGIGVLVCLLPYFCYTKGLESVTPANASIIATLEPVVAAVLGVAVFHDELTWEAILGIVLILSSICFVHIRFPNKP